MKKIAKPSVNIPVLVAPLIIHPRLNTQST